MAQSLERSIKQFVEAVGYSTCKKAGLSGTITAFYLGMTPSSDQDRDFDEIVNELGLSRKDANYWEDIWYKKDSWFNQMS